MCLLCVVIIAGCKKDKAPDPIIPPTKAVTDRPFTIATILQSNMVIQRDKPAKVWGTGKAKSKITVTAGWAQPVTATTGNDGYWSATIPATAANAAPQTLRIVARDETPVVFDNILIGDVWICAGQSNMAMPVGPLAPSFAGVENFAAEIAMANYPQIRTFTVKENYQNTPQTDFAKPGSWVACTPENAGSLSATAYFFARKLHTDLSVPIGIIVSAVNGSWCETWASLSTLKNDELLSAYIGRNQSSTLFNGMIAPLTPLSIKGFTWYQGENNQKMNPVSDYTRLNAALINGWRHEFKQDDLPFYYVQITPFDDGGAANPTLNYLAKFREAQSNVRSRAQGAGMVVTMDAGEVNNHHPKYKKQVGERLALLALNNTYGKNVKSVGPQYASFTQSGNKVIISFTNSEGLNTINNAPVNQYFFVAAADQKFYPAMAVIEGDKISLTIPAEITASVTAVRYAFTNYPITNLQNSAGLPMEPFRTDNWSN
jgi:sialate O-acetylesterase